MYLSKAPKSRPKHGRAIAAILALTTTAAGLAISLNSGKGSKPDEQHDDTVEVITTPTPAVLRPSPQTVGRGIKKAIFDVNGLRKMQRKIGPSALEQMVESSKPQEKQFIRKNFNSRKLLSLKEHCRLLLSRGSFSNYVPGSDTLFSRTSELLYGLYDAVSLEQNNDINFDSVVSSICGVTNYKHAFQDGIAKNLHLALTGESLNPYKKNLLIKDADKLLREYAGTTVTKLGLSPELLADNGIDPKSPDSQLQPTTDLTKLKEGIRMEHSILAQKISQAVTPEALEHYKQRIRNLQDLIRMIMIFHPHETYLSLTGNSRYSLENIIHDAEGCFTKKDGDYLPDVQ